MFIFIILGTIFTVTYSVRLGFYLFFKNFGVKRVLLIEERLVITIPIRMLFFFAVTAGGIIRWIYFPGGFIFLSYFFKIIILFLVFLFFFYFI